MESTGKITNVGSLTKDQIAGLYFNDLRGESTKKNHPPTVAGAAHPTIAEIGLAFKAWYAGFCALANWLDPGVELPSAQEMVGLIGGQFERATKAA